MGVKISNLPVIVTPALTDIFPVVQNGVTYQESFTQFTGLFANAPVNTNITSMTGLTGFLQAPMGIKDTNGNIIFSFTPVALAVNYIDIQNSMAGANPYLIGAGTDANIGVSIYAKGAGIHHIRTTSNTGVIFETGTAQQHITSFAFANTASSKVATFPDYSGTVNISSGANGTEAANAVTASGTAGVITTSALTTAAGASYVITWTNAFISANSVVILSLMGGTNTKNTTQLKATAGAGTSTLTITNNNAAALDGTLFIGYMVIP